MQLAGPLVVSFWMRAALTMVIDTLYAGFLEHPDAALAAFGLTAPFDFLMIACWVGTSNGLTARLGAAMGAKEGAKIEQLKKAAMHVILALIAIFWGIAAFIWFYADDMVDDPVVADMFQTYGVVLMAGMGTTAFWSVLPDSIIKAHHDTRSTMWAGLLSGVSNFVLNSLFLFVFHWGIFGIALATVMARISSLVYALHRARVHEHCRKEKGQDTKPGLFAKPRLAILAIALPSGASFVLMAFESQAILEVLKRIPESRELLAGWSVFDRAARFLMMPVIAISVALLPLTARSFGRRDLGGIRSALKVAFAAGLGYVLVFVVPICLLFGPRVAVFLTESELAGDIASYGMFAVPLAVAVSMPFFYLRSTFEGLQRPKPGLFFAVLRSVVLVVPMVQAGVWAAAQWQISAMIGACAGFLIGVGLSSLFFGLWTVRIFPRASTLMNEYEASNS